MCQPLFYAVLAQMVEQPTCNRQAGGSSPSIGTKAVQARTEKNTLNDRAWSARAWAGGEKIWL